MRKVIVFLVVSLFSMSVVAQFPMAYNSKTVDVSKVTGNFDSFNWTWVGQNDQSNKLWFASAMTNSYPAGWIQLTNYYAGFRISKRGTVYVDILTPPIILCGSSMVFTVARTNIPPNDTYQAEVWMYSTTATNQARTIAQGTINVVKSLYSDTNSFPFPTNWDMSAYMLIAQGDSRYVRQATNLPSGAGAVLVANDTSGTNSHWATVLGDMQSATYDPVGTNMQLVGTNDARLSDARTPTAHNQGWSTITSTPTSLGGYGVTDVVVAAEADPIWGAVSSAVQSGAALGATASQPGHTQPLSSITNAGTAAGSAVGDFATAAQGIAATNAQQRAGVLEGATNDYYSRSNPSNYISSYAETQTLAHVLAMGNNAEGGTISNIETITFGNGIKGKKHSISTGGPGTQLRLRDSADNEVLTSRTNERALYGTNGNGGNAIDFATGYIDRSDLTDVASAAQGSNADDWASSKSSVVTQQTSYIDIYSPASFTNAPAANFARLAGQTVNGQSWLNLLQSDGSVWRIPRDIPFTVYNGTGSVLTNGAAVYFTTNLYGTTAHYVALARADNAATMPVQGVVCGDNIQTNATGNIMFIGRTPTNYLPAAIAALPAGTPLYASVTEAGGYQQGEPSAGQYRQIVGYVNGAGAMDVRIKQSDVMPSTAVNRQWNLWPMSNSVVETTGAKAMRLVNEVIPAGSWWTNSVTSNGNYIVFCSPAMGLSQLKSGVYSLNINMGMAGSASPALSEAAEIYIRQTNGTLVELTPTSGTTPQSIPNGGFLEYVFTLSIATDTVCNVTDSIRVALKSSGQHGTTALIIKSGTFTAPIPSGEFVTINDFNIYTNIPKGSQSPVTNTMNFAGNGATNMSTLYTTNLYVNGTQVTGAGSQSPVTNTMNFAGNIATNMATLYTTNLNVMGNITFAVITNSPANNYHLMATVSGGVTNYAWIDTSQYLNLSLHTNASTSAGSIPIPLECVTSNVISTATNFYTMNITNVAAATAYLPNSSSTQSWDITFEINWTNGTNAFSFATNGFCVVTLATNFSLPTNAVTMVLAHKSINSSSWNLYSTAPSGGTINANTLQGNNAAYFRDAFHLTNLNFTGNAVFSNNITANSNLTVLGTGIFSSASFTGINYGGIFTNVPIVYATNVTADSLTVAGTNISFGLITNLSFAGAVLKVGNVASNFYYWGNATPAESTPAYWELTSSNAFSTDANYYSINVTNVLAVGYLPNPNSNQTWELVFEINWNDGTNWFYFETNGFCQIKFSTNIPPYSVATNKVTTARFRKRANTTYWTGRTDVDD